MNNTIKKWVHGTLHLDDLGERKTHILSDIQKMVYDAKEAINSLVVHASSNGELRLPVKQGMKTLQVSPLTFIANLAQQASHFASLLYKSEPFTANAYGAIFNHAIYKIHSTLSHLEDNGASHKEIAEITGVNGFLDYEDTTLNIIHTLCQCKTFVSESPAPVSPTISIQRYVNNEGLDTSFDLTEKLSASVSGPNSYLLNKVLNHPSLDYQTYRKNIIQLDSNNPVMYRFASRDFAGAAMLIDKLTKDFNASQRNELLVKYAEELTRFNALSLHHAEYPYSSVFSKGAAQNEPIKPNVQLVSASSPEFHQEITLAYAITSANGISPFGEMSIYDSADIINDDNAQVLDKVIKFHIMEHVANAGKRHFTTEELQQASEQVNEYISRTVRL
jgi:hypothetical protein